jgi:hypothetical protein
MEIINAIGCVVFPISILHILEMRKTILDVTTVRTEEVIFVRTIVCEKLVDSYELEEE